MTPPIKSPRKLIEVALPLDAINAAAAREKSIRHGHPSTLHLWWARRPLAAARAVIFAQMVNDPGYQQGGGFKYGKNKKDAAQERKRLFKIIEDLVQWENSTNETVLERARAEIRRSWREVCELNKEHPQAAELFDPEQLPAFHDPFAGGGAIPLEAQRLGLEAYASDLNPVAVLINRSMIEIPPKFAGVHPVSRPKHGKKQSEGLDLGQDWPGSTGLAEDIRHYGAWMRAEAENRIGHYFPPVTITDALARGRPGLETLVGQEFTVIAWLWTRTVKSPNPAFSHVDVPLASTFVLSSKAGKEAYVVPVVTGDTYSFDVRTAGESKFSAAEYENAVRGTRFAKAQDFFCLLSQTPISRGRIQELGKNQEIGQRLMAIVVDGPKGRYYLPPNVLHEESARSASDNPIVAEARTTFLRGQTPSRAMITGGVCSAYGLATWGHLFTPRQLVALTTFSDLVAELRERIKADASVGEHADVAGKPFAESYAQAVSVYLAFAVSKITNIGSSIATWMNDRGAFRETFARQAIPMTWDFAEANPFADAGGSIEAALNKGASAVAAFPSNKPGFAIQADAAVQEISHNKLVSTDPPYYDNIGYADLSEFFYVWLRRSLRPVFPELFATISVPKNDELVATRYRHGSQQKAEAFFLDGMTKAMKKLADQAHPAWPITIYYAFKQSDTKADAGTSSPGWETFLEAVNRSGLQLVGTWPVRTEGAGRLIAKDTNALASSIVLVCRKRPQDAQTISRREFLRELNGILPDALDEMTKGAGDERSRVAPVDLSQAIIGPGMAVFSKYDAVLEANGSRMSVKTALQLINRFLAEDDFDHDTQFCLHWFEQHGWIDGPFGDADVLSRAKATSVGRLSEMGVVHGSGGKVRLLKWTEYSTDWTPRANSQASVWKALHELIRALKTGGEPAAGILLAAVTSKAEAMRQLAYRLYTLCERLGQAEDARAYNELITSWSGVESAAATSPKPSDQSLPGFEH